MSRPVSRPAVIWSIVKKDLKDYSRDKLWVFLSSLTIVVMIIMFWVLPEGVNESISVGVTGLEYPELLAGMQGEQEAGLQLVPFTTKEELKSVVAGEANAYRHNGQTLVIPVKPDVKVEQPSGSEKTDVEIGLAFPSDFFAATAAGKKTVVEVFIDAAVPSEIKSSMSSLIRELAFAVSGNQLPIKTQDPTEVYVVLGEDRAGNQITPRQSARPMFVFMILLMEMFGMSSLIARELQNRTVTSILVTPATTGDVLAAKGITGVLMGLFQAVVLLAAINVLQTHPLLILTLMLLGALMVSGAAMIAGTFGRDFMGNLFYGFAFMIPLLIPAFGALFPGSASPWIRILPSYPLVKGLVNVATYGDGWSSTLGELGALLAWCVGLFVIGWIVLKRKVERL